MIIRYLKYHFVSSKNSLNQLVADRLTSERSILLFKISFLNCSYDQFNLKNTFCIKALVVQVGQC
jgi:hypothetical protein